MTYWQGALQIVGPTQQGAFSRVSTDDEIKNFLAEQKSKREEILGAGARARNTAQFNVVPPVLEVSK
jgi:hypothetical protein